MRILAFILSLFLVGCTTHTQGLNDAKARQWEQAQVFAVGTGDALGEVEEESPAVDVARTLNRDEQSVLGLPPPGRRIDAHGLIEGNAKARKDLAGRESEITSDEEARQYHERALLKLGSQKEAENNASIWRRLVASFGLLGAIGVLVGIGIVCPPALFLILKLLMMFVRWLVAQVPSLIDFMGVVGSDAMAAVVKGVQDTKDELDKDPKKTYTAAEVRALLATNLAITTDQKHKNIIKKLR